MDATTRLALEQMLSARWHELANIAKGDAENAEGITPKECLYRQFEVEYIVRVIAGMQ